MKKVLLDTDVLLDFLFDRAPFSKYATEVLNLCKINVIRGYATPLIIANIHYLLRKTAKHEMVIEKLSQLLTMIDIVQMNRNTVLKALHSDFKDFEDALQNYAAIETKEITVILTGNIKDF